MAVMMPYPVTFLKIARQINLLYAFKDIGPGFCALLNHKSVKAVKPFGVRRIRVPGHMALNTRQPAVKGFILIKKASFSIVPVSLLGKPRRSFFFHLLAPPILIIPFQ